MTNELSICLIGGDSGISASLAMTREHSGNVYSPGGGVNVAQDSQL